MINPLVSAVLKTLNAVVRQMETINTDHKLVNKDNDWTSKHVKMAKNVNVLNTQHNKKRFNVICVYTSNI